MLKVTCRVQVWKKHFVKIASSLDTVLLKITCLCIYVNDMFMYLLCITKNSIILSLFYIDTLDFTMLYFNDFDTSFT